MLTTFERQLFRQYLVVNAIYLCVILGLYSIIDLFDNVDDFMSQSDHQSYFEIASRVMLFYGRIALFIFDAAAIPMIAISALTVLLLCKRRGQVKPFLSAGIPTYRVLAPPLLLGVCVMVGLKMVNREVLLGDAIHYLHANRAGDQKTVHQVVMTRDYASGITIASGAVLPASRSIKEADFFLPTEITGQDPVSLHGEMATFFPRKGNRPSGWLFKNTQPPLADLPLTDLGKKYVLGAKQPQNLFIVSDVTPDLICKAKESSGFLSTGQLLERINSPAIDNNTARDLEFSFHSRVIEPFLAALLIWIAIPVILQKESRGMIVNAGECGFWLFLVIGFTYAVRFLPPLQVAEPVQAAWIPLFLTAPIAVWMLDRVET